MERPPSYADKSADAGFVRYAGRKVRPGPCVIDLGELEGMGVATGLLPAGDGCRVLRILGSTSVIWDASERVEFSPEDGA